MFLVSIVVKRSFDAYRVAWIVLRPVLRREVGSNHLHPHENSDVTITPISLHTRSQESYREHGIRRKEELHLAFNFGLEHKLCMFASKLTLRLPATVELHDRQDWEIVITCAMHKFLESAVSRGDIPRCTTGCGVLSCRHGGWISSPYLPPVMSPENLEPGNFFPSGKSLWPHRGNHHLAMWNNISLSAEEASQNWRTTSECLRPVLLDT